MKIKAIFFNLLLLFFLLHGAKATASEKNEKNRDIKKEYAEFKTHHLKDTHSFKLFYYKKGDKKYYVSFPLPIIAYSYRLKNLDIFMSSSFYD